MANDQQFPTGVYKCSAAGKYSGNGGRKYDNKAAANQAELDVLLGDGWSLSLPAAEDAYDLTKPQTGPAIPSTSTPEERAAAADALQAEAAYRLNQADEALTAAQALADTQAKSLADATAKCDAATEKRDAAEAEYQESAALKASALASSLAADKDLTSCRVRRAAADRALDDAAGKVLTTGDLLTQAKQKAMDREVAKRKALAAAQAKETPPPPRQETPPPPGEPGPPPAKPRAKV